MPAATKKTTARRPRKTAAAKPADDAVKTAVEAALKVYKTRVASQVQHYKDTGDLCEEEANNIRRELELEEYLPHHVTLKMELCGDLNFTPEARAPYDDSSVAFATAEAVRKLLRDGLEVEAEHWRRGVLNTVKGKVVLSGDCNDVSEATLEDN